MRRYVETKIRPLLLMIALIGLRVGGAHADPAPFDLAGPVLEVKVTRGETTLPIAEVPNLSGGDRLWIHADMPATQSAHYLMVVAFLRGSTNPPPDNWFYRCETWVGKCAHEGLAVTVPHDAQQVMLFLAPQTGGDFKTLVSAVRGRPGAFVRASQDLNQATLDRGRLEIYLAEIRALNKTDPAKLKDAAPLLARSLAIKVDEKCLERKPEFQAACLMQGQNSLILDDGHSTSIVEALTGGPASDLAMAATYTPQLNYGYYSPYVASVLDIARIMDSFRTAQYQYIPALVLQQEDKLALLLNTPPSFHNPKSVLVVALPAVEQAQLPPLHAVNTKDIYCASKKLLALPVEGAPLVFSTAYAHDLTLRLMGKDGKEVELPSRADSQEGGFVVNTASLSGADVPERTRGAVHGHWGFEDYDGPTFEFVKTPAQPWEVAARDASVVLAGHENTVHLQAVSVNCIESITLAGADGKQLKTEWSVVKPNELEVRLPLQQTRPGLVTLLVTQYGASQPQSMQLHAFSEATHLEHFALHAGDSQGILTGTHLAEVTSLTLAGIEFVPDATAADQGADGVRMLARDASAAAALKQGDPAKATVTLQDGRVIDLNASVNAPRPRVKLIDKSVQPSPSSGDSNILLTNQDELPQGAKLTFSVRAQLPRTFARDERIEVATADETFSTTLSLGNGSITLENSSVALATLDPAKAFGPSAFGPLQFRVIASGVAGEWQQLATLVRLPALKELSCPASNELACKLTGSNLYLLDSVAGDSQFHNAAHVPEGFPGYSLAVPHPADGELYVKLRDDPSAVHRAALAVQQLTSDEGGHPTARQAAVTVDANANSGSHAATTPLQTPPLQSASPPQPPRE